MASLVQLENSMLVVYVKEITLRVPIVLVLSMERLLWVCAFCYKIDQSTFLYYFGSLSFNPSYQIYHCLLSKENCVLQLHGIQDISTSNMEPFMKPWLKSCVQFYETIRQYSINLLHFLSVFLIPYGKSLRQNLIRCSIYFLLIH